ncbi:hypothetical protein CVT26_001797 [Gymnopilus dilepis]|uniref:Uncharacterized protein n=1 Tax=Gymnopilus dilepis TaxID=231916 RepID=A0A409Y423_9AGAR|nr:hypothetical protein CVT26_001797 [Gymnopilus dilepis]
MSAETHMYVQGEVGIGQDEVHDDKQVNCPSRTDDMDKVLEVYEILTMGNEKQRGGSPAMYRVDFSTPAEKHVLRETKMRQRGYDGAERERYFRRGT